MHMFQMHPTAHHNFDCRQHIYVAQTLLDTNVTYFDDNLLLLDPVFITK